MIPGLTYKENIISEEFRQKFQEYAATVRWDKILSRDTKQFGHFYNYKDQSVTKTDSIPSLFEYLYQYFEKKGSDPDQCIVNKYEPGQGISPHTDNVYRFTDRVVVFSFGSSIIMKFTNGEESKELLLTPGSMLIMEGDARYKWKHEIAARKSDNGVSRGTRISVTFRWVK